MRNGMYYGAKVRVVHALVMTILFGKGPLKQKLISIIKLTWEHSRNLGIFVFLYKSLVCVLSKLRNKTSDVHSLISGAVCGYIIFGEKTSVNS